MKHRLILLLLLFALLTGFALPAAAQDEGFRLGDGYSITLPEGIKISLDKDGFYILTDGFAEIWLFTPSQLQAYVSHTRSTEAEDIMTEFATLFETDLTSDVTPLDIGEREGLTAEWSDGELIVLKMDDGFYGIVWPAGSINDADFETLVTSFDGNFTLGEESDIDGKGSDAGDSGDAGGSVGTGEPCLVSTDARDSARLRVGPGENRGAIAFLPVNTPVTVTGRLEADDGSIWYQLDKNEAMPGTSANELWVAADEVAAEGDCDSVGDTSAPPVIPGVVAPPPQTGGDSGGGGGGEVVGGAIPHGGSWTVSWNPTTNASCQGGGNVAFPTSELQGDLVYTLFLSVRSDGASFSDGQDTYTRTGPNSYFGTFTFDFGENAQLYINVVNNRSMNGSATGNFTVDGIPCSYTTTFTLTHN